MNINVIQNNNVYNIYFQYDPSIVALMHNIPGAAFDRDSKSWVIGKEQLGWFINEFKGTRFEPWVHIYSDEELGRNETFDDVATIPDIDILDIDIRVEAGSKLYAHQIDFLKYAKEKGTNGYLLADEPGLGKTLEIINIALYNRKCYGFKHCLVITCVNSAKFNWKADIEKHTNGQEDGYLLGTTLYKRKGKGEKYDLTPENKCLDLINLRKYKGQGDPLPYFIILNVEGLRYKAGGMYAIAARIADLINEGEINMVVLDECHKGISPTSQQGKLILEIKKATQRKAQWIPMTGTPIVNRPTDLFTPLRLIDAHSTRSYYEWCKHFAVYGGHDDKEVLVYKNISQLKKLLHGHMIRRLADQVLDLPPIIRIPIYVENTAYQKRLYTKIAKELEARAGEITEQKTNPLVEMLKLRQVNDAPELVDPELKIDKSYLNKNAKLAEIISYIDEFVASGEKVVVFAKYLEPLKTLYKFIATKYKTACFTGSMSDAKREQHKKVFMNDPECKVLIGTIDAMGTSHTFTAARVGIFFEESWTAADQEQAEKRLHRISTNGTVRFYTFLAANTVDDRVHRIIYEKKATSDYIVDNIDVRHNPEAFLQLLGNY